MLAIPCQERRWVASAEGIQAARVDELARTLAPAAWQRISAGAGAKGERLYGWVFLPAQQQGEAVPLRGLLVRRSLEDAEDRAYHIVFAPRGAMLEELVRVAPGGAGRLRSPLKLPSRRSAWISARSASGARGIAS